MSADAPTPLRKAVGHLLLTAFGLGAAPRMPGTVASLAVAALVWLLATDPLSSAALCVLLLVYGVVVTLRFTVAAEQRAGHGDPSWVVSDEVAGQALACAGAVPLGCSWPAVLAAFVLFRLLDVLKPWPVGALERLPGPAGVLMDDVAAGAIAGIAVYGAGLLGVLPAA